MPPERPAHPEPLPGQRGILCPYCGSVSAADPKRCERCGGHFDPLSRQATQNAMGPWFIRDLAAPFRPGCSFETLRELIKRGKVTKETILRGPSTRQYWNFASRTPGIANLLGVCHNCHVSVRSDDFSCAACGAVFSPETDRQHMGLAPVHLLPGQAAPEIIAAASVDQARTAPRRVAPPRPVAPAPAPAARDAGVVKVLGILLGALIVLGAASIGVIRFVLPVLRNDAPTPPVRQAASVQPTAKPVPVEPAPEPAAPTPTGSDQTPAAPAPDPKPDLLASFLIEPFDAAAVQKRIEDQGPGFASADRWVDLVRARGEHLRLRSLP